MGRWSWAFALPVPLQASDVHVQTCTLPDRIKIICNSICLNIVRNCLILIAQSAELRYTGCRPVPYILILVSYMARLFVLHKVITS